MSMAIQKNRRFGVSVIICCYNSCLLLRETLQCLAVQEQTENIPWEIIVVDNASTDGTAELAKTMWAFADMAPLRIVTEPVKGLANARVAGINAAEYQVVSFVDDDNRVNPKWISIVAQLFSTHPEIGISGAYPIPAPEGSLPEWYPRYAGAYAGNIDEQEFGDVTCRPQAVIGAGLAMRVDVWLKLVQAGFRFMTTGRQGSRLSSGEDRELVFAAAMSGYRIWYERSLWFHHYIPNSRLDWAYLRRLHYGYGASSVITEAYRYILTAEETTSVPSYWKKLGRNIRALLSARQLSAWLSARTGCHEAIQFEFRMGRLCALAGHLFRYRSLYACLYGLKTRLQQP